MLYRSPFNLFRLLLDDGGGQGGGGGAGTGDGNVTTGNDPGKKDGKGEQDTKTMVSMSQEDFDKLIQERLKRHEKKIREEIKKEQEEEQKKAQMTELEKEKAAREKAENEAKAAKDEVNQALKRAAVLVEAAKAGAYDSEDVVALADLSTVEIDDNKKVTGADKVVEALRKAKPHLFKQSDGKGGFVPGSNFRGEDKGGKDDETERMKKLAEERNKGNTQIPAHGLNLWK